MFVYTNKKKDALKKTTAPSEQFKALATRMVPKMPEKNMFSQFKLPAAFFAAIIGIKSFYVPPFSFTTFSTAFFQAEFGKTLAQASFYSSFISMLAGFTGPVMGPLSDYLGNRALWMAGVIGLSIAGFILLAVTELNPLVACTMSALCYGYGDTCAYCSIRLIVGEKRAGIGYGVYGVCGNALSFIIPLIAGIVLERWVYSIHI
ncbi:major facilitator superfamily protein [Kipferlia bialata]|uniref:Lysosomal dipeptide transporter MFSD1 n=1 Tax=Kipferlia bialata TaxID=797122 RepID=A0A9K3CX69_9EUKA|nr:major facilitator superfamily protein [Kipferlia bialata]|eukprot:g6562.t1